MHGILLLDKPAGMSSNSALQRVRRLLGGCKAGHAGSLDPLATGMLPLCLGEATKVAGEILSNRKRYQFTLALGARTATGDREGPVVEEAPVPAGWQDGLQAALRGFLGPSAPNPADVLGAEARRPTALPAGARRGDGRACPAGDRDPGAGAGIADRGGGGARRALLKGTYVRTLAEDIARALGTCGHVTALRRNWVEPFEEERMQTLEAVTRACEQGRPSCCR